MQRRVLTCQLPGRPTPQVRGKDVPRPVKSWNQCGLSGRILEMLRKAGMTDPMPIQAQARPHRPPMLNLKC